MDTDKYTDDIDDSILSLIKSFQAVGLTVVVDDNILIISSERGEDHRISIKRAKELLAKLSRAITIEPVR